MRAILIDPVAKSVTEVDYNGDYRQIYTLIGAETFDGVSIGDSHTIFVDDEGLYKEDQSYFKVDTYPQPLAGKGLVLAVDDEGESVAAEISLEEMTNRVTFPAIALDGFIDTSGEIDHPILGRVQHIGHHPVFRKR